MVNKKLLLSVIIGMILVFAGSIALLTYRQHQATLTNVTIKYNTIPGVKVQLYKGERKDLVDPKTTGDSLYAVKNGQTYTLEDWPYVVVVSGDSIEPQRQIIYPHQVDTTITISVSIRKDTLKSILASEKSFIESAISNSNSNIHKFYAIQNTQLFGDGSWATARLKYTGKDRYSRDSLVVLLHKDNSGWKVTAGPKITISKSEAPEAPEKAFWSIYPQEVKPS